MRSCRTNPAFLGSRISASRDKLASCYRKPSKGVAMIREVYPLVASICDIQLLGASMMNTVDHGKHYKRVVL